LHAGPEDDEALRRKLWLSIAREVVRGGIKSGEAGGGEGRPGQQEGQGGLEAEQQLHIKQAVELLKEAGGWLLLRRGALGSGWPWLGPPCGSPRTPLPCRAPPAAASRRGRAARPRTRAAPQTRLHLAPPSPRPPPPAGGLLRIEDVLPFFPDFVTIDNFRAAICESLQRYTRHIEGLEREMDEATAIAEALRRWAPGAGRRGRERGAGAGLAGGPPRPHFPRGCACALLGCPAVRRLQPPSLCPASSSPPPPRRDLRTAQRRAAVVSLEEPCARCGRALGQAPPNPLGLPSGGAVPPLYVFPSGGWRAALGRQHP
jgi:hypothetical protein